MGRPRQRRGGKSICPRGGKVRYASAENADRERFVLQAQHRVAYRAYSCEHCGGWHLTTRVGGG